VYRLLNVSVAACFGTTLAYLCVDKVQSFVGNLDDVSLFGGGLVVFLAFIVLSWFVLDSNPRKA